MSQENVEIVREVVTEFTTSRRLSPKVAPEFVWDMSGANWPGQSEFHGRGGYLDFFRDWSEAYTGWEQEIEQLIDAGRGLVVALMRQRAQLPGGDSWVALEFGVVYTVEDGLVTRGDVFLPPQAALEAAGLRE